LYCAVFLKKKKFSDIRLIRRENNPLTLAIMHAPRTAYARSLEGEAGMVNRKSHWRLIGNNAVLVGAVQAKNNARVVFTGSLDMFSDEFINSNYVQEGKKIVQTGNRDFVKAVTEWVFKRKGVLRVKSIRHHRSGELVPPPDYTIMDAVEYEIEVEELKNGAWVPYTVNDMQMEFVRIDPFIRMTMKSKGIFQLKVVFTHQNLICYCYYYYYYYYYYKLVNIKRISKCRTYMECTSFWSTTVALVGHT
ncbi:Dolichyl-diphosphooligosaccharide--protein glycosyltransferase 48 kDa subunit, partial [Trichinella pseudospiralis]